MSATAAEVSPYLFVYGTLMTRTRGLLGACERARLQREGTNLGPATIAGRLIDLGTEPGLLEPANSGDVVHGELFHLEQPTEVMSWLDSYEEVSPETTPKDEYARILMKVHLPSGEEVRAWVYCYRGSTYDRPVITSGRWDG